MVRHQIAEIEGLRVEVGRYKAAFRICRSLLFATLLITAVLTWFTVTQGFSQKYETTQIFTEGLNAEQIAEVNDVVGQIRPYYKEVTQSIKVVNNMSVGFPLLFRAFQHDPAHVLGYNWKDNIVVEYDPNPINFRQTLCHEIIHSIARSGETAHLFVDDIADYLVCFKQYETSKGIYRPLRRSS